MTAVPASCLICALEHSEVEHVVFRDPLWAAEVVPAFAVPGWFFLRARRHAERITGLDEGEVATLGRRARDLVAAVTEATGAETTYVLVFGENFPHFHAVVTARGEEVPEDKRSGDILSLAPQWVDQAAALRLVPAVRAAYARIAGATPVPAH